MAQKKKQDNRGKPTEINFGIDSISLLESSITIPADYNPGITEGYKFSLQIFTNVDEENSIYKITIGYKFFIKKELVQLFSIKVSTDFKVDQLAKNIADGKTMSDDFIGFILEMSLNHVRGVQSQIVKDSPLKNLLIPHIPIEKLMEKRIAI